MKEASDSLMVDKTLIALKGANVRQVLSSLARAAALDIGVRESYIAARLFDQEQKAPSGIGGGVAIPHLRLKKITRPYSLLARLARPIAFNAVDDRPVDLAFVLLSPDADVALHLQRLSRVSRLLRDPDLCASLRNVGGPDGMAALMMGIPDVRHAA